MKKTGCFLLLFLLVPIGIADAQIVSTGTTSGDSIAVSLFITDSLGNPSFLPADSFFISVLGPSGDSIIALAGVAATAGLDVDSLYSSLTGWNYIFNERVAEIDGSGRAGVYELRFCGKCINPVLVNCETRTFQIVSNPLDEQLLKLTDILDSMIVVLDSLNSRPISVVASATVDSIDARRPDVNMASVSGDDAAADNLESMLDGTGGADLTLGGLMIEGAHGDSGSFRVINSSGTAVRFESTGGNGSGLHTIGTGDGEGVKATGGMLGGGNGIQATGGIGGADFAGDVTGSLYGQMYGDVHGTTTPTDTNSSGLLIARTGDSLAFQGEASGLSKAQIADTLIKSGMVRYNQPDSILQLRGLHIVGTEPGDTAFVAIGNGSGHGGYFGSSGTGHGGYFRGGLTSGHGIIGWTNNGHGMALFGSQEKAGLYCEATDSGAGAYFLGGDLSNGSDIGPGMRIRGRVDDGLYISAGTESNKHGIQVDGGTGPGGDAIRILGYGDGGDGISISAAAGEALDGGTRNEIARSLWGYKIDTAWAAGSFGDSAKSWSASSPLGGGIYPVTISVLDSTSMQSVPQVRLSVLNATGDVVLAGGLTDENGLCTFNLDAGTYRITAFSPGYILTSIDEVQITGSTTDTLSGYRFDPGQPSAPDLCRVYGFLYGIDGQPIEGASITFELQSGTRLGAALVSPYAKSATTDSVGYYFIDVIPSDDLQKGDAYTVTAGYPAGMILRKEITVPDMPTWQLTWE
ncbi:MAG: carboxypeptidase-like regulatory domain-containing protein [Candidatus Zixiibacteriota bacterium]